MPAVTERVGNKAVPTGMHPDCFAVVLLGQTQKQILQLEAQHRVFRGAGGYADKFAVVLKVINGVNGEAYFFVTVQNNFAKEGFAVSDLIQDQRNKTPVRIIVRDLAQSHVSRRKVSRGEQGEFVQRGVHLRIRAIPTPRIASAPTPKAT